MWRLSVIFLVLIICSIKANAQTITPRIAEKIGLYCQSNVNVRAVCYQCLSNKYVIDSRWELDKILASLADHRDMAQDIILYLYRSVGEDQFGLMLYNQGRGWFSIQEIETMMKFCKPRIEQEQKDERERQRIEAERQRQRNEAEAKQRQLQVDRFLAEREEKVYEMNESHNQYNKNKEQIYTAISTIIDSYKIRDASFTLIDKCIVEYSGRNRHTVQITGITNGNLITDIKYAVEKLNFAVLTVKEPYTQEDYTVTSESEYIIPYKVITTKENLTLLRGFNGFELVKGDRFFFSNSNVQQSITNKLAKRGKYKVEITEFQNGNRSDVETSILNYKKSNRFFIGAGLSDVSDKTGIRAMFGVTDIKCSIFGWYASIGGVSVETYRAKASQTQNRYEGFLGITVSVANPLVFYGGLGLSYCEKKKRDQYGYNQTIATQSNFATEVGIMLRIKHFYLSTAYDFVMYNEPLFNVGCGLIF